MKIIDVVTLLVCASGTLVAQAGQTLQTGSTAPSESMMSALPGSLCVVSGKVVSASDGIGLKSARVSLRGGFGPFTATTDSEGKFEIKKVTPGRYYFVAKRNGYVSQQYQAHSTDQGALLALDPGQQVTDVLFRLTRGAVVTGRAVDEEGEPMPGVEVSALRKAKQVEDHGFRQRHSLVQVSTSITNDLGEYRIFGLKPGSYYLRAADSGKAAAASMMMGGNYGDIDDWNQGSEYPPLYYPGVWQLDQAQLFLVRAGEESNVDFALRRARVVTISGRVIGPDGKAAETYIRLEELGAPSGSWMIDHGTTSDTEGKFTLRDVSSGTYIVEAQTRDSGKFYSARQKVEVGKDDIDSLLLSFGKGTNLTGRLVNAGDSALKLDSARLFLMPVDDDAVSIGNAPIQKDGSFEFDHLAEGSYALQVMGLSHVYVKSARLGSDDVLEKGVQVEKAMASTNLEVVVSSALAHLDGSVTSSNQPVIGATVRAVPQPETPFTELRSRQVVTDQHGRFTFDEIRPGEYKIIATDASDEEGDEEATSYSRLVKLGEREQKEIQLEIKAPPSQ